MPTKKQDKISVLYTLYTVFLEIKWENTPDRMVAGIPQI